VRASNIGEVVIARHAMRQFGVENKRRYAELQARKRLELV